VRVALRTKAWILLILLVALSCLVAMHIWSSRIQVFSQEVSVTASPDGSGNSDVNVKVKVRCRIECKVSLEGPQERSELDLLQRKGEIREYGIDLPSVPPGNYTFLLSVSNGVWSLSRSFAVEVPSRALPEPCLNWELFHIPLTNQSLSWKGVPIIATSRGRDSARVVGVELWISFGTWWSRVPLSLYRPNHWRAYVRFPKEGPIRYYLRAVDDENREVRVPKEGSYAFHVKREPLSSIEYVLSARRPDGYFGPRDYPGIEGWWWTRRALESLSIFGEKVDLPPRGEVAKPSTARELFDYLSCQRLLGLASNVSSEYMPMVGGILRKTLRKASEEGSFDVNTLQQLYFCVESMYLMNMSIPNGSLIRILLRNNARQDGGWGNPSENGSNIPFTYYASAVLERLGWNYSRDSMLLFAAMCQNPDGGYGFEPGSPSDVRYTWQAVRIFTLAAKKPPNVLSTIDWIRSLQNGDGGFGCKPGRPSDMESTFLALDCLRLLGTGPSGSEIAQAPRTPLKDRLCSKGWHSAARARHMEQQFRTGVQRVCFVQRDSGLPHVFEKKVRCCGGCQRIGFTAVFF